MKVAVACEKGLVSEHFGHSDSFEIYSIENETPIFLELLNCPKHEHGSLPKFLLNANVDVVICGGIGQSAVQRMVEQGMDILSGAKGVVSDIINLYANNELVSKDIQCNGHDHDHNHECHHD